MGNTQCSTLKLLLAGVAVIIGSVTAAVTPAGAHAGNTDPNAIHACINTSSNTTKIVGVAGSCSSQETPLHWGIVGPRGAQGPQGATGPQGPPGTVASFDNLAGLPCTRNGSVGATAILYAPNGDATLRCVLSQVPSPPGSDVSGAYTVNPGIQFSCALGLAHFGVSSFYFNVSGTQLTVDGAPETMTGSVSDSGFNVEGTGSFDYVFGTVQETYTLTGTFDPATGNWAGTFQALFSGPGVDLGGCSGATYQIQGSRQ